MAYLRLDRRRWCLLPDQAPPDAVVLVQGRDERRAACVSETRISETRPSSDDRGAVRLRQIVGKVWNWSRKDLPQGPQPPKPAARSDQSPHALSMGGDPL